MTQSTSQNIAQNTARLVRPLKAVVVFGVLAASLAGCVVYPTGGYRGGYAYAPAPVYAAPPVVFGFGYGGRWGDDD
ncbi:MAG: hypothetical protein POG74_06260 [Acidocella sp.]|nr:hypothetical protein [Acidocella sp.]